MSALIVPLLYPDSAQSADFSDPVSGQLLDRRRLVQDLTVAPHIPVSGCFRVRDSFEFVLVWWAATGFKKNYFVPGGFGTL